MKRKILIPIPSYGCDPSETAIPWKLLKEVGFEITFITPDGKQGKTDTIMLTGDGLGPFKKSIDSEKRCARCVL